MGHLHYIHLSATELCAIKLDGEVSQYGEFWDVVHDWRDRSQKTLGDEKHPLVLTGKSAAWAHGACGEPLKHTASTITSSRIRHAANRALRIEERTLVPNDYWLCGQTGVTSPLRTITDILRCEIFRIEEAELIEVLTKKYSINMDNIYESINNMGSVPYKKLALQRSLSISL